MLRPLEMRRNDCKNGKKSTMCIGCQFLNDEVMIEVVKEQEVCLT